MDLVLPPIYRSQGVLGLNPVTVYMRSYIKGYICTLVTNTVGTKNLA